MMPVRLVVPILALALVGSGCASLLQMLRLVFQEPTLRFKSATVGDLTLTDATVNLTWELENPNPVGLSLASLDYGLFVEGNQVVAGAPPLGLTINPGGKSELVFPARVRFQDLAPVITTFLQKDTASYRAQGSIGVQVGRQTFPLPLSYEGTFEVPKVPKVAMKTPRITQITFASATVEFPLAITNLNSYQLPIGNLAGALTIAGSKVGTLSAQNIGLDPKGTREVKIPLTIQFAQAGAAAMALRTGSATVAFDGALSSGSGSIPLKFQQNLNFQR